MVSLWEEHLSEPGRGLLEWALKAKLSVILEVIEVYIQTFLGGWVRGVFIGARVSVTGHLE